MLISRTMPSKVFSTLKLFLKLNDPPPAAIVNAGEINSVLPTAAGSGANAPVAALVHPAGSAGATTPSKFSLQPGPGGVGVAVGVGVAGVPVGVAVGVGVGPVGGNAMSPSCVSVGPPNVPMNVGAPVVWLIVARRFMLPPVVVNMA